MQFRRGRCPACAKLRSDASRSAARTLNSKCTQFKKSLPPIRRGQKFGNWTVIADELLVGKYFVASVRCSCGKICAVPVDNLHKGASKGCKACGMKKTQKARKEFYGYADVCPDADLRRRLMCRIAACVSRCHNPNDASFASYGARGIHVFEPWRTNRKAFLAYLMTLPNVDRAVSLELDRAHTDQGYMPGNLRFITRSENMKNKRQVNQLSARILELEHELTRLKNAPESI